MNIIALRIIFRRFLELMFTGALVSAVLTVLNISGILENEVSLLAGMLAGTAVFMYADYRMLQNCYFDLTDKPLYYFTNITAYIIFAAAGFLTYALGSGNVYTWLFAVTKFARYMNIGITAVCSALIFHIMGLAVVFIATIGMDWVFSYNSGAEKE